MTQKKRIKRSRDDLLQELNDQISLLQHSCQSYDSGLMPEGKRIALSLRVLLHNNRSSRSLLEQLNLRNRRFLNTAGVLNPSNSLPENHLCAMRMGTGQDVVLPWCLVGSSIFGERWIPFDKWWNDPVVKDDQSRYFNRRQLILNVADTDGGAHVDPTLDEAYMDLSRNNSLGWEIVEGDKSRPFPPPTMACMRQIAHECLLTLRKNLKGELVFKYTNLSAAIGT